MGKGSAELSPRPWSIPAFFFPRYFSQLFTFLLFASPYPSVHSDSPVNLSPNMYELRGLRVFPTASFRTKSPIRPLCLRRLHYYYTLRLIGRLFSGSVVYPMFLSYNSCLPPNFPVVLFSRGKAKSDIGFRNPHPAGLPTVIDFHLFLLFSALNFRQFLIFHYGLYQMWPFFEIRCPGAPAPLIGRTTADVPAYAPFRPTVLSMANELTHLMIDEGDPNRHIPPHLVLRFLLPRETNNRKSFYPTPMPVVSDAASRISRKSTCRPPGPVHPPANLHLRLYRCSPRLIAV